jgi:hypothetical protein
VRDAESPGRREERRSGAATSHPRLDLLWRLRPRREIEGRGAGELRPRSTGGAASCCRWWKCGWVEWRPEIGVCFWFPMLLLGAQVAIWFSNLCGLAVSWNAGEAGA